MWKRKLDSRPIPWFYLATLGIFLFSLLLRFWNLGQFNKLVFDEVYYAKFANNYLTGTPFFNAHPPLSQYLIAIGIWIGSYFPASPETVNDLTGSLRSTISYRWLNAFIGSFIPLVISAIAYQLTRRKSYALIVAIFAATDGLFLVESRYALNNIYLVLFGLLGQLFFLLYLAGKSNRQCLLITAGIFLGSSAAIKWNGLSFLLGIYFLLAVAKVSTFLTILNVNEGPVTNFWKKLASVKLPQIIINLAILPFLTYSLLWIPHLLMNPEYGFWRMQQEILSYHQRIGSGTDVHPYCSPWYSWPIMWRPIAYFYQKSTTGEIIYDVHAMGNPILWWLSTGAVLVLILFLVIRLIISVRDRKKYPVDINTCLGVYVICNYLANLLPWITVKRCIFLYHYMSAYVFAWLALAWIVDGYLRSSSVIFRRIGLAIICSIIIAFIYWLPIYLGLPLSPTGFQMRIFLPNWI